MTAGLEGEPEARPGGTHRTAPEPDPTFRAWMKAAGLDDPMTFARNFAAGMVNMATAG